MRHFLELMKKLSPPVEVKVVSAPILTVPEYDWLEEVLTSLQLMFALTADKVPISTLASAAKVAVTSVVREERFVIAFSN